MSALRVITASRFSEMRHTTLCARTTPDTMRRAGRNRKRDDARRMGEKRREPERTTGAGCRTSLVGGGPDGQVGPVESVDVHGDVALQAAAGRGGPEESHHSNQRQARETEDGRCVCFWFQFFFLGAHLSCPRRPRATCPAVGQACAACLRISANTICGGGKRVRV